jgi:hypothetical protein
MRVTLIAGNWKMNKLRKEAVAFAQALPALLPPGHSSELLICPPFTLLWELQPLLAKAGVKMGAQDLFWEDNGAYTGEISARSGECPKYHTNPKGGFHSMSKILKVTPLTIIPCWWNSSTQ